MRYVKPWSCPQCEASCQFDAMILCRMEGQECPIVRQDVVSLCNADGQAFEFGIEHYHEFADFLKARRMFLVFWSETILAPYNDSRTHLEWFGELIRRKHRFRKGGWKTAQMILNTWPRGYLLNNRVVVYIGDAHSAPLEANMSMLLKALRPAFPGCELWLGVEKGQPNEIWPPQHYWGKL